MAADFASIRSLAFDLLGYADDEDLDGADDAVRDLLRLIEQPAEPQSQAITFTYADEAWEWAYELLTSYVDKQLTLDINGKTYETIALVASDGSDRWGHADIIRAHPWDEDRDLASEEVVDIPLFVNGIWAIDSVHMH